MKKCLLVIVFCCALIPAKAQNILVVNDNDNITYNSDTLTDDLDFTMYGANYDYWSIPDSAGVFPTAAQMAGYDLVIWYCSTDGVGLALWDASTAGNNEVTTQIVTGQKFWIIGQDILYQMYGATATTFTSGEFAYDFMGLDSYDSQSYVNDGATGVPQVDRVTGASTLFPATLTWTFSTLWYVDGCTAHSGTKEIYEMGPSSYSLWGAKSMFHNDQLGYNVMSTFFDPALINTRANRINFLEKGITYLLSSAGVNEHASAGKLSIYPNPATNYLTVANTETAAGSIRIFDGKGRLVIEETKAVNESNKRIDISSLNAGIYFVQLSTENGTTSSEKLVIGK